MTDLKKSKWIKKNEFNSKMIMQVHDELVFEVQKEFVEQMQAVVIPIMTASPRLTQLVGSQLEVHVSVGACWG